MPASLGGSWIDRRVCGQCNARANDVADRLVAQDFLVRFLRSHYEVADRYGRVPSPPVVAARLESGGVVKATLGNSGPTFKAGVPADVADSLQLGTPDAEGRLRELFARGHGAASGDEAGDSISAARLAQRRVTPPEAWSRFIAKLGLACGREAYGDEWLDDRQAVILSRDLLGGGAPRFAQRTHHPPVEPAWPFEPPRHQLWIEPRDDTAILMVAIFGQILGAVPVNDLPAEARVSSWTLDPHARSCWRTSWHAMWGANVARRANKAGGTPVLIQTDDGPLVFIPDGPEGPIDMGIELPHVDSPREALEWAARQRER